MLPFSFWLFQRLHDNEMEETIVKLNRWINGAIPAVLVHISIGAVYAWSVFSQPVMDALQVTLSEVSWAFSIAIFFLGMSAAFLGTFVEKMGPKKASLVSGIFYGAGLVGSAFAIHMGSLFLLYLFYGAIGGIGLGIGYIAPVKTLVNWFYDRRGLATGLAIMGFGFASAIAGPLIRGLIDFVGLQQTFLTLGIGYFVIIFVASRLICPAPPEYIQRMQPTTGSLLHQKQYTVGEAMMTREFYALWFMLFINITCGIALLSVASPLLQEMTGISAVAAAAIVGIMGIFNGAGRLFWASASDFFGRAKVYTSFFVLEIVSVLVLSQLSAALPFQILLFIVISCYGGGFSCMPAYLSDIYGTRQLSAIHGRVLSAWAMAGIAGPCIITWSRSISNQYNNSLYIFAVLYACALVVSLFLMHYLKKKRQLAEQNMEAAQQETEK